LQRMISEMLFIARADRGMIELKKEDIQVELEAASVAEYFEAAAAEKSQRIEVQGVATFTADRLMLRRALTNLLSNAVRYSPSGARIRIGIHDAADGLRISVANPGDAIPKAELDRLFSRFARRDESRGRDVEGTGLGLAIVDSIMNLQRGRVEAKSEDSLITFTLHFPRGPQQPS
jgi:two-component system heavy metal sensor histidine kinase CusS